MSTNRNIDKVISIETASRYIRRYGGSLSGWQEAELWSVNNLKGKQIARTSNPERRQK